MSVEFYRESPGKFYLVEQLLIGGLGVLKRVQTLASSSDRSRRREEPGVHKGGFSTVKGGLAIVI